MLDKKIPTDWCKTAQALWLKNQKNKAINQAVQTMNTYGVKKPKGCYEQLAYYLYLANDYKSAMFFLEQALIAYPNDLQLMVNLASTYSKSNYNEKAIELGKRIINSDKTNINIYDIMCSASYEVNDLISAASYGRQSLAIKDQQYCASQLTPLHLNLTAPLAEVATKQKVIAYSLWGNNPRYINGALRNLILAKDIYPDWQLWLYIDDSVDVQYIEAFETLGAIILKQPQNQSTRQKLCWRFNVASHPDVGYFMVRDIDSVINVREYHAVQEWLTSTHPFHIMRDWWTHTDLILAGMWGGIANVLPNINNLLSNFNSGKMDTPHIDQWFLGQVIWPSIKQHSLIHDRCFHQETSIPVPGNNPKGNTHIGACEYSQNSVKQEEYLAPWKAMLLPINQL